MADSKVCGACSAYDSCCDGLRRRAIRAEVKLAEWRKEVKALRQEFSQAKADLAITEKNHANDVRNWREEIKKREAAESALKEQERVIAECLPFLEECARHHRDDFVLEGCDKSNPADTQGPLGRMRNVLTTPQAEKPKEPCRNMTHTRADGQCFDCGRPVEKPQSGGGA